MSDVIEIEVTIKRNGKIVGEPYYGNLTFAEAQELTTTRPNGDVGLHPVVGSDLAVLNVVLLRSDSQLLAQINAGVSFQLNPGGFILVWNGVINAGATTNLQIENNGPTNPATLTGVVAGP